MREINCWEGSSCHCQRSPVAFAVVDGVVVGDVDGAAVDGGGDVGGSDAAVEAFVAVGGKGQRVGRQRATASFQKRECNRYLLGSCGAG